MSVVSTCMHATLIGGGPGESGLLEDRQGILADVTTKIAGLKTNMLKVEATTSDHHGRIVVTMEIADLKHLQRIIKVIRGVQGVVEVERMMR